MTSTDTARRTDWWWDEEAPTNINAIIAECLGSHASDVRLPESVRRRLRHLDHLKRHAEIERDIALDYSEREAD